MVEYILTVFIILVVLYALIKGCNVNINITFKQEFCEEDRQLLQDLYDKDGEERDKQDERLRESLDDAVRSINNLMLGIEEESDG